MKLEYYLTPFHLCTRAAVGMTIKYSQRVGEPNFQRIYDLFPLGRDVAATSSISYKYQQDKSLGLGINISDHE